MATAKNYVILLTTLLAISSEHAFAQNSGRTSLAKTWTEEHKDNQSIYQAAPTTQVVPTFNTITYAVLADFISATVEREHTQAIYQPDETLKLGGYTLAPHVSISLKKIGLGFAGEVGKKSAYYYYDGEGVGGQDTAQESILDYRGFGLSAYYILPQPFGKRVKPSLTLGYSAYSAKHSVSTFVYEAGEATIEESQIQKFNYNVSRSEAGLNIGIQLLKKFTLIPWVNYEYIDTSAGYTEADQATQQGSGLYADVLKEDIELFWNSSPRTRYGIDFVIRIFKSVDIHFGGLLGAFASLGPKNDQIDDSGYSLSFSIDQKGN